ncbi:MAG: universal stress protein [Pseudomonadota bacterium]
MSKRLVHSVLHPTDFSESSNLAFAQALAISLVGDTTLTILHVGPEKERDVKWSSFPPVRKTLERWGLLAPDSPQTAVQEELDIRIRKLAVRSRTPVQAIVSHLNHDPADLIVLGTEARKGSVRLSERSDAEAIARWSKTMTLFVSPRARRGVVSPADGSGSLTNVLVPVDAAPNCEMALTFATRAAEMLGDPPVNITLLHVGERFPALPPLAEGEEWVWRKEVQDGEPVERILSAARQHKADLIVMATAGYEGVLDALRGSTTERVVRGADCPVLAVPAQ